MTTDTPPEQTTVPSFTVYVVAVPVDPARGVAYWYRYENVVGVERAPEFLSPPSVTHAIKIRFANGGGVALMHNAQLIYTRDISITQGAVGPFGMSS